MSSVRHCCLCEKGTLSTLIKLENLPISHYLRRRPEEPDPRFSIRFDVCSDCGLLQISDPVPADLLYAHADTYTTGFQKPRHLDDLITTVVALQDPDSAIDIGCNDGALMEALQRGGYRTLVGIEPNQVAADLARRKGYPVYAGFLGPGLVEKALAEYGQFGVAYIRHVVEHVVDLAGFFASVRRLLKPNGLLVMELPEVEGAMALGSPAILWEEHVNYFTQPLSEFLLERNGFEVLERRRYAFGGGSIAFVARMRDAVAPCSFEHPIVGPEANAMRVFANRMGRQKDELSSLVRDARGAGFKIVMYGAAPRSCLVGSVCGISDLIDFVVDDREDIQGRLMPGTEQVIRPLSQVVAQTGAAALYLLGVGAENEFKVRHRIEATSDSRIVFVSLFPPRDTLESIAAARRLISK